MEITDILTLDDNNQYVIASKVNYENKNYYYLADINKPENLLFCYENKGELVEVIDRKLLKELIPLFYEASKDLLPSLNQLPEGE